MGERTCDLQFKDVLQTWVNCPISPLVPLGNLSRGKDVCVGTS